MDKKQELRFFRYHKIYFRLYTAVMAALLLFLVIFFSLWLSRRNEDEKRAALDGYANEIADFFLNIENNSLLLSRNEYVMAFDEYGAAEIEAASPAEIMRCKTDLAHYNAVLNDVTEIAVYFKRSGYYMSASELGGIADYQNGLNMRDDELAQLDGIFDDSRSELFLNLSGTAHVLFVKRSAFSNTFYMYLIGKAFFENAGELFFKSGEGFVITNDGASVFEREGKNAASFTRVIRRPSLTVEYYYTGPTGMILFVDAFIVLIAGVLYASLYIAIEAILRSVYMRFQKMYAAADLNLDPKEASVFAVIQNAISGVAVKERELESKVRDNTNTLTALYLGLLLDNQLGDDSQSERIFSFMKIPGAGTNTVICFKDDVGISESETFLRIRKNVWLCIKPEPPEFDAVYGVSNTYRRLKDIARAYPEAVLALKTAVLTGAQRVVYGDYERPELPASVESVLTRFKLDLSGNRSEVFAALQEVFDYIERAKGLNAPNAADAVVNAINESSSFFDLPGAPLDVL
ncbi:MAG: hypothetical protein LBS99_01640, partial [Clostridiales bacterium]|nr:hypothetical protein [Clostridiales bacterium]